MAEAAAAQFRDPRTVAAYLGQMVGTHYCAALRATEAYARHLAPVRESLLSERFKGDGLGAFWREVMESEELEGDSFEALASLARDPRFFFRHFLDGADGAYRSRYEEVPPPLRKKVGHTQHAQCIRILRDHDGGIFGSHFAVQNQVVKWIQMTRALGQYRN